MVAVRGIPDIIGVCNGKFFAWELKATDKDKADPLQRHVLEKIKRAGGIARVVSPGHFSVALRELKDL